MLFSRHLSRVNNHNNLIKLGLYFQTIFCALLFLFFSSNTRAYIAGANIINYSSTHVVTADNINIEMGTLLKPNVGNKTYVDVALSKDDKITAQKSYLVEIETVQDRLNQIAKASYQVDGCQIDIKMSSLEMEDSIKFHNDKQDECQHLRLKHRVDGRDYHPNEIQVKRAADNYTWIDQIKVQPDQMGVLVDKDNGRITINNNLLNNQITFIRPTIANPKEKTKPMAAVQYSCESSLDGITINCNDTNTNMLLSFTNMLDNNQDFVVTVTGHYYIPGDGKFITATTQKLIHYVAETYL